MPDKIVLLGKEEKNFYFLQEALRNIKYQFEYISAENLSEVKFRLLDASLIIIDTIPYQDALTHHFSFLREDPSFRSIPVLALVPEKPVRLRYQLTEMGMDDYLLVPFDRLDIQVRVKNLLRLRQREERKTPKTPLEKSIPQDMIDGLTTLYKTINKAILSEKSTEEPLNVILQYLQQFSDAQYVFLFETGAQDLLSLKRVHPEIANPPLSTLSISELPIVLKAVRLQKPTILNNISPASPLVGYLNALIPEKIQSIIVYPIPIEYAIRYVLFIIKTDENPFDDFHYNLVQHLTHLFTSLFYLNSLEKNVSSKLDSKVWKFLFEFLDQVMNQLDFGIMVIGKDTHLKYLNNGAAKLLNVNAKEVIYKSIKSTLEPRLVKMILEVGEQDTDVNERPEIELVNEEGEKKLLGFSVHTFTDKLNKEEGYIVVLKDITFLKEIQEEMRRVDRLASLGMMASGIAHEIRNPLAGIKAMAQTFEEELAEDDPRIEYVKRIVRLVNRLDDLLRTLFSYARPSKPNPQFTEVTPIVSEVFDLVQQKAQENNVTIAIDIQPNFPEIFIDPAQLQQVLLNLLLNSVEAIHDQGTIQVKLELFHPKEIRNIKNRTHARYFAMLKKMPHLKIHIKDNGCGIAEENLEHIFNPFYTTKPYGTGLGLSIVYQIIKENEGIIYYESEIGVGTDCYVFIPIKKIRTLTEKSSG
ncbi:MAG: hypothetical protein D6748_05530 [Calditrichaeota bacterium]|nr:MAG: hypothetical protein D6748_05530 [Calditrichota bacterium]